MDNHQGLTIVHATFAPSPAVRFLPSLSMVFPFPSVPRASSVRWPGAVVSVPPFSSARRPPFLFGYRLPQFTLLQTRLSASLPFFPLYPTLKFLPERWGEVSRRNAALFLRDEAESGM